MAYLEQQPGRREWYLLLLLFLCGYLINLGVAELRTDEALLAGISAEMNVSDNPICTMVQGQQVDAFPLYPWLVSLCSGFRHASELTTRLPAVLAVLAMACLCGGAAARVGGTISGAVAATMVMTTVVSYREGVRAGSDTVFAFLISAAWLAWYRLGRDEKRWVAAWFVSLLFVLAGVFVAGFRALAFFYLPLFFLRRPLRGRRRMLFPAHFGALAIVFLVLLLWRTAAPGQALLPWNVLVLRSVSGATKGYLRHLIRFPFESAAYLLPWVFLLWPAFCMAHRPLEKNRVFCHYLRVIVFSLFLCGWILPGSSPRSLLPVLGPLSILTGLHYEILVRRHHAQLRRVFAAALIATFAATAVALTTGFLHIAGIVVLEGFATRALVMNMMLLILVLGVACWLYRHGPMRPFWLSLMVVVTLLRVSYLTSVVPVRAWYRNERKDKAEVLGARVAPGAHVYKTTNRFLVTECFYLNRPVSVATDPEKQIPADTQRVYALADAKPPILTTRTWTPCSDLVDIRRRRKLKFEWFPGAACLLRIDPIPHEGDEENSATQVRMYRGELRFEGG